MDEDRLIAKKDVLRMTGISYGQLYRWKRKGLIPESWFVRRSTFTGQETFFPREKIFERIERIKEMKESHPLDDLADVITKHVDAALHVSLKALKELDWLDEGILQTCDIDSSREQPLSLKDALCAGVLSGIREKCRPEELDLVRRTLQAKLSEEVIERISEGALHLHLLRKRVSGGGISAEVSAVILAQNDAIFDPDLEEVAVVDLKNVLERIKLDLARFEQRGKEEAQ
jgi:DNA-binding transcriptional MerR regulator